MQKNKSLQLGSSHHDWCGFAALKGNERLRDAHRVNKRSTNGARVVTLLPALLLQRWRERGAAREGCLQSQV